MGFNRGNNIWSCTAQSCGNIYLQSLECVYYVHKKSLTEKNLLTRDRELRFYLCCNDIDFDYRFLTGTGFCFGVVQCLVCFSPSQSLLLYEKMLCLFY